MTPPDGGGPGSVLVQLPGWDTRPWIDALSAHLPGRTVSLPEDGCPPGQVHYVVTFKPPSGELGRFARLRAVFSTGAGVDGIIASGVPDGVPVLRVTGSTSTAAQVSEWVVMHSLIHLRRQRTYDAHQRRHVWAPGRVQPVAGDLRAGVMGLGLVGAEAARKLAAVGFDVAGWSRRPRDLAGIRTFSGDGGLEPFLARTDILVCLLPLTPMTHGLVDAALIGKMARDGVLGGPILLNAARGAIHKEHDILAALDDGRLLAATLDVFETEPLPAASPLWDHPRVTVTPHNAAVSSPDSVAQQIAARIRAFEAGKGWGETTDLARGY